MAEAIFTHEGTNTPIDAVEEIGPFIRSIRDAHPGHRPIFFFSTDKGFFNLGVGDDFGFLDFQGEGDPPYWASLGHPELTVRDGEEDFYINGDHSPIPHRYCIPLDELIRVLEDFFITGELSNRIQWENYN